MDRMLLNNKQNFNQKDTLMVLIKNYILFHSQVSYYLLTNYQHLTDNNFLLNKLLILK
jgi:hypothetical protein